MRFHGKSIFSRPKENTESLIENNQDDEEFKKYDAYVSRLYQAVNNREKTLSHVENDFSANRTPSIGKNKSNLIKLTISRTRDERNDKDFLATLMNNDFMPILPKNLHLLSDDDTNQSISNIEKFKNLSSLMIDDKESYTDNFFVRNAEDRLILKLYTTLGRQAKKIFLEEDNSEKLERKRLLFHKLNDIKIPKFEFNKLFQEEKSENNSNDKNHEKEKEKEKDNNISSISISEEEENENEKDNEENEVKEEKEEKEEEKEEKEEKDECYFRNEEKGYFNIPELINIKEYQKTHQNLKKKPSIKIDDEINEKKLEDNENFWDPKIDEEFLSYINHNIIRIEDIYNKEEKTKNKNEEKVEPNEYMKDMKDIKDIDEDSIIPVNAQEVIASDSEEEDEDKIYIKEQLKLNNKSAVLSDDEEETPKKSRIKFSEFCGISPIEVEVSYQIDQQKIKDEEENCELKVKLNTEREKINGFDEKLFPARGTSYSNKLIYKIAIRNEKNEIVESDRFTIIGIPKKEIKENNSIKNKIRKGSKKKTMAYTSKNLLFKNKINDISKKKNSFQNANNSFTIKTKKSVNFDINIKNKDMNINNNIMKKEEENSKLKNSIINNSNSNKENNNNSKMKSSSSCSSSNSSSSGTIHKIKLEDKKDEINLNNNINEKSLHSTRKDYTLKDLLNNDSITSGKINKNFENNSDLFSCKESFSINKSKNTIKNEEIKSPGNLRRKDDDKNFSSSQLSDSLSGSQKINTKNKMDLTFSSRQS